MADERDVLDEIGTPSCRSCGHLMEAAGTAHHLPGDRAVVVGSAWWECPACRHVSLI